MFSAIPSAVKLPAVGPARAAPTNGLPSTQYDALFEQSEREYGLPPGMLKAVAAAESGFRPDAVSPKGAQGLMQFMPATAEQFGIDPRDPTQAIPAAAKYLRQNYDRFKDWSLSLASYNWGEGNVEKMLAGQAVAPDETKRYTQLIIGRLNAPKPRNDPVGSNTRGADIGVSEDGRVYVNGEVFDSKDYGKAIALYRAGAFTSPGQGRLPQGFIKPNPGDVETYFQKIVPATASGKSFAAGIQNYAAGWNELLGAAEQAVGRSPAENTGMAAADRRKRYSEQLGAINPLPQTFDSAEGVGGVSQLAYGKVLESAPYIAELLGAGIIGGLVKMIGLKGARVVAQEAMQEAARVALARGATAEQAQVAARKVAEETLSLGTRFAPEIGIFSAGLPSSAGDILGNQREQAGEYNTPAAVGLALPYSAFNLLGGGAQLARAVTGDAVRGAVMGVPGVAGRVVRGAGATAVTAAEQGVQEFGQEVVNQAGRVSVDPSASMTSPEALERYRESAIVGGLIGVPFGTVSGVGARSPTDQVDLMNPVPPAPPAPPAPPSEPTRPAQPDMVVPPSTFGPFGDSIGLGSPVAPEDITGNAPAFQGEPPPPPAGVPPAPPGLPIGGYTVEGERDATLEPFGESIGLGDVVAPEDIASNVPAFQGQPPTSPPVRTPTPPAPAAPAAAAPVAQTEAPTDEPVGKPASDVEQLLSIRHPKRAIAPEPSAGQKVRAAANVALSKQLHEAALNDGELNENLARIDSLNSQLRGFSRWKSRAKEFEGAISSDTAIANWRGGRNRLADAARERVARIESVLDYFDQLVKKHGVAAVNAMFQYRKKNNLEMKPGLKEATKEDQEAQVNNNVRLSNLWRLYREGHFNANPFAFSRGDDAAMGRTRLEEGAKAKTLQDWYAGKHKTLTKQKISGIQALAYYMRHNARTDLEGLIGGRLLEIFQRSNADIGFIVVPGKTITNKGDNTGAAGKFITPKPGESTALTVEGKTYRIDKPTLLIAEEAATEQVVPHELIHAALAHIVNTSEDVRAKFSPIIAALRKVDTEGLSDQLKIMIEQSTNENNNIAVNELLAYGFTNPEFQDFLKTVKMPPPPKARGVLAQITNGFEFFVNLVKLTLGLHNVPYSAMARLIEEGARVMDIAAVSPRRDVATSLSTATELDSTTALTLGKKLTTGGLGLFTPVKAIDSAYKFLIKHTFPFFHAEVGEQSGWEKWATRNWAKLSSRVISNHPVISYIAHNVIDKWGVPEQWKAWLDMGRKRTHNAGQIAMSWWEQLRGFTDGSEENQKLVFEYLRTNGKMDISKLPKHAQEFVQNMNDMMREAIDRAVEQQVLPKHLLGANPTEIIQYIDGNTARLALGLKTSGTFTFAKMSKYSVVKRAVNESIFGTGTEYYEGTTTVAGQPEVYVATNMPLVDAEKELGAKINLDTSRTFRVAREMKTQKVMSSGLSYAEAKARLEAVSVIDSLVYTMHNLLHDTAVSEYMNYVTTTADLDPDNEMVFKNKESLLIFLGGDESKVLDKLDAPRLKLLARTPGYWVKMPSTGYGSLSGKYVPSTVYSIATDVNEPVFGDTYNSALNFWKKTKTAWSIPTHFNNISSSFVMAYMNDIPVASIAEAFDTFVKATRAEKKLKEGSTLTSEERVAMEAFDEFEKSGALVASYRSGELAASVNEKIDNAIKRARHGESAAFLVQLLHTIEKTKAAAIVGKTADVFVDIYQNEDNVFRLAAYMEGRRRGYDQSKAGKFAADSMINYSIDAKYINNLRKTVMPFLAWPYRMVPMLARTAMFKPWKLLTMITVVQALNTMSYAITGTDEEDEREDLPEYLRGSLFLMPGAPQALRMPFNANGNPVFWNISNFMPLGNFTDVARGGMFGLPWPQGLMPSGPLMVAAELALNHNAFTNQPIWRTTDSVPQQFGSTLKAAWQAFSPNIPLPFNRQGDIIYDMLRNKHGIAGDEMSWGPIILGMVGPKMYAIDPNERHAQMGRQVQAIVQEYRGAMIKAARDEARYENPDFDKIAEERAATIARMLDKIRKAKNTTEE